MAYDGSLKFDTKVDQAGFDAGIGKLKSTAMAAIGAIGAAFATGAIAKSMINQIKLTEQYGSAINDQAQRLSVSVKKYQELSYIFEQTGGSADSLQMGIKTLSSAVVDGNKGFEELGIHLEDARKMSQEDLFDTVITALASMEEGSERTALATDLLGRSATELNPLLNMGADGLAKMRQEAQSYGIIMSDTAVAATDKYGDAVTLAQKTSEALRNAMVGKMLPALTDIALGFADVGKEATAAFNERGIRGVIDVITDRFPVATAAVSGLVAAFASMLIIKGLTIVTVAFQTAQVSLALGMMGTTAAALLQTGQLTILEIITAALTGKVTLAAAAQALWNSIMLANPVMLLVVAIGALVGGLVLVEKNFDKINPKMAQYTEAVKEASNETKALNDNARDSANAYAEATTEIDKQAMAAESLVDKLYEMSASYSGSSIEQRKMQAIIDELNGSVDGLSLTYNVNTGAVSMNKAAVLDLVAAKKEEAKMNADLERSVELVKEESDAKYNLWVAQKNYNDLAATGADKTSAAMRFAAKSLREAKTNYDNASKSVDKYNQYIDETGYGYDYASERAELLREKQDALTGAMADTADEIERVIIGGYDFTDSLDEIGMTADEVSGRLDNFTGAATNMFEKINTKSRDTAKSVTVTLDFNTKAMEDYATNIANLAGKLPQELLDALSKNPEKFAGFVKNLAGASDAELAGLSESFTNAGDAAKKAWLASLGAGTEEENPLVKSLDGVVDAATKTGSDAGDAIIAAIQSKDYSGATDKMSDSFRRSFEKIGVGFTKLLTDIHYNLAQTIGGVSIDIAAMAYDINYAMSKIKTQITIHVNVVYDEGTEPTTPTTTPTDKVNPKIKPGITLPVGGSSMATVGKIANISALIDPSRIIANTSAASGVGNVTNSTVVNAPITVAGVVESDAQLARKITNQFTEVVMYGR